MKQRTRNIKMIIFDLDGVLVDIDSSWQAVHKALGVNNKENFQKYLRGEIDYKEFMKSDIHLWKGTHIDRIKDILSLVKLMKGARETIKTLREMGYKTAIVSSGISILADRIMSELGMDYSFANRLLGNEEGRLSGMGEQVVGLLDKGRVLRKLAMMEGISTIQCAVVGDSRFDITMFEEAGFSIAFNAKDEIVEEASDLIIEDRDLRRILPWFKKTYTQ